MKDRFSNHISNLNKNFKDIDDFIEYIRNILEKREERLVSEEVKSKLREQQSAVLFNLIYSKELRNSEVSLLDNIYLLLEKRSMHMKNPGDMAFPGGKADDEDDSLFDTAVREAEEEVGFERELIDFIGYMDEYVSSSQLIVRAVISKSELDYPISKIRDIVDNKYSPITSESEFTVVIPLSHCLDPKNYSSKTYSLNDGRTGYIRFIDIHRYLEHTRIWGLTATIIRRFIDIIFPENILDNEPN